MLIKIDDKQYVDPARIIYIHSIRKLKTCIILRNRNDNITIVTDTSIEDILKQYQGYVVKSKLEEKQMPAVTEEEINSKPSHLKSAKPSGIGFDVVKSLFPIRDPSGKVIENSIVTLEDEEFINPPDNAIAVDPPVTPPSPLSGTILDTSKSSPSSITDYPPDQLD